MGEIDSYSPFKADVYSLGRTAVAAASLDLPRECWPIAGLEEKTRQVVQALDYSPELQQLLIGMLSYEEAQRPSMQQVYDALVPLPSESSPSQEVFKQTSALFDYEVGPIIYRNTQTALSIYEGRPNATKEPVVIKTYECEHLGSVNEKLKEGLIQAWFEHPNVCRLIDIKVSKEKSLYSAYLIAEKLDRNLLEDIQARAKARRPVSEAELVTFLRQIGNALKCAQLKGLAHRDIKPESILIDSDGHYKLCGFGCAWQRLALTLTNSFQGTLPYTCKQVRLAYVSEEYRYNPYKADIYALGITTLYLAALAPPFRQSKSGPGFVSLATETLDSLLLTEGFKRLLQAMLAEEEAQRADLDAVLSTIGA